MSEPITIKERRAVEWREQEVSYTYEELLELFGDDDCSAVRPLVLRCMALEQERATFYEDYQRKFDVETKALHAEIERLRQFLARANADHDRACDALAAATRERDEAVALLRQLQSANCDGLHHERRDYHGADKRCPILARIDACLVPKVKP